MLQLHCNGTPREIGLKHGRDAKAAVLGSIDFYTSMFQRTAQMNWSKVRALALDFEPVLREKWPAYLEEIEAIAEGAGVVTADIIALNVRTEIAFGLFSDGCTAVSWQTADGASYLAQNWDWEVAQAANLIQMTIEQPGKPTIKMITEAGVIGKIGLNSAGVGVCLNAIRAHGMDRDRIPCHLGLRLVLESPSREAAVRSLERDGVASACHMLIADGATGGVGLEWSARNLRKVEMNSSGQIFHTNHWLLEHEGVADTNWLPDSEFRVARIQELSSRLGPTPDPKAVKAMFTDEENFPASICRATRPDSTVATLFCIVMDLRVRVAEVVMGRPVEAVESFVLAF